MKLFIRDGELKEFVNYYKRFRATHRAIRPHTGNRLGGCWSCRHNSNNKCPEKCNVFGLVISNSNYAITCEGWSINEDSI